MSKSAWRFTLLLSALFTISAVISISYYRRPELFNSHLSTTNVKVEKEKVASLYLSYDASLNPKLNASKCYYSDRRESTVRRSDMKLGGKVGSCLAIEDKWVFYGKKGAFTLLPVSSIPNQQALDHYRQSRKEVMWHLPKIQRVQLFINRLFVGEYLKLDLSKLDNFELWEIEGDSIYTFNANLEEVGNLFFQTLSDPLIKIITPPFSGQVRLLAVNHHRQAYELPLPYSLRIFNPALKPKLVKLETILPAPKGQSND